MTVNDMNSSGMTNLFASMNNNSKNGLFGMNISDYNMIRSGSYFRMMKSYYNMDSVNKQNTMDAFNSKYHTSTSRESGEVLAKIESTTDALGESAEALYASDSKAFKKTNGKEFDTEAIFEAVSSFVGDYNAVIRAAGKSEVDGIARSAASLATATNQNEKALRELGITIDKDSLSLSIDKETFMKSDMTRVKSLFQGTGSYAYNVATKSSMLNYQAKREASKSNTYGNNGNYNSNYMSGSLFNSYF